MLEQTLCGHVREGDVPGYEIPERYFRFVRNGDARPLEGVLEHNRLDLISLALVTAQAAQLLDEGPAGARTLREAFGLGALYERGGLLDRAREAYARAAGLAASPGPATQPATHAAGRPVPTDDAALRAEALRAYALVCRRQRRYDDAAVAWRAVLDLRHAPAGIVREATEALAVHHEHRLRDFHAARTFALSSLRAAPTGAATRALQHRLARLDRKLAPPAAPLF